MTSRLESNRTLVTSAARRTGRATCPAFADDGAVWPPTAIPNALVSFDGTPPRITTRVHDVTDSDAASAPAAEVGARDVPPTLA